MGIDYLQRFSKIPYFKCVILLFLPMCGIIIIIKEVGFVKYISVSQAAKKWGVPSAALAAIAMKAAWKERTRS